MKEMKENKGNNTHKQQTHINQLLIFNLLIHSFSFSTTANY
jgi:hypothetical protein